MDDNGLYITFNKVSIEALTEMVVKNWTNTDSLSGWIFLQETIVDKNCPIILT